jgi:hypothetical protein
MAETVFFSMITSVNSVNVQAAWQQKIYYFDNWVMKNAQQHFCTLISITHWLAELCVDTT